MAGTIETIDDPLAFEAIDGTWQFDLDFYRDIGLDLAPLEDPAETAAMPRLRRAAEVVVASQTSTGASENQRDRANQLLLNAHRDVRGLVSRSAARINYAQIGVDHPAVRAWQERDAERDATKPRTRTVEQILAQSISWIHVGLIRARMPEVDPDYVKAKYVPITLPNANYYDNPLEVANQLTLARVGVWWDL